MHQNDTIKCTQSINLLNDVRSLIESSKMPGNEASTITSGFSVCLAVEVDAAAKTLKLILCIFIASSNCRLHQSFILPSNAEDLQFLQLPLGPICNPHSTM